MSIIFIKNSNSFISFTLLLKPRVRINNFDCKKKSETSKRDRSTKKFSFQK